MPVFSRIVLSLLVLSITACARISPEVIQSGSNGYNIAMQSTRDEQLLLNLVRLKYRDTPFFLEVGSVSSQFRMSSEASASANLGRRPILDTLGLSSKHSFVEQPTVTFTPLGGNDFVQHLLTPISLDTVLLLSNSGWSVERILRLCTQYMNGLPNAPTASGPTPTDKPDYASFSELSALLRNLQQQKLLRLGYRQEGEKITRTVQISATEQNQADINKFRQLLSLAPDSREYVLSEGQAGEKDGQSINLATRSLMGVLFYLSHSVQVPESDKQSGIVTITRDSAGNEFDWGLLTANLFHIRSSQTEPQGASIRTRYRNSWFYIDDADLDSKSTFSLLSQLFSLQAGNTESARPLLTLPIGQ